MSAMTSSKINSAYSTAKRGVLLIELLVAVSILAVILSISSESVYVSMQSGKTSSDSDVAFGLANEALEAVRAVSDETWQNIYALSKGVSYHPVATASKWTLASGSEVVTLNLVSYTRSVVINDVSRDPLTRMIESTYVPEHNDPSTQQAVVTVSWQGSGSPVVVRDYFFRWRNKTCVQTDWSGGATGATGVPCVGATTYDSVSPAGTISTAGGVLKLQ